MSRLFRHRGVRPLIVLAAGVLGTAGLSLNVLPSAAQESTTQTTRPSSEAGTSTNRDSSDLSEGGSQSRSSGGGARQSGNRIENVAYDLRLEDARIESVNLDDDDEEFAVFEFGRVVHDVSNASGFSLLGFDSNASVKASDARLVQGDPGEVLVSFPSGTDLSRYTMAQVDTGTVEDEAGEANLPGSVSLDGSRSGSSSDPTDGPDLESVRAIDSLERVEYRYDEQIDEGAGDASKLGFYTEDGLLVRARSIVTAEDNILIAQFDRQTEDGELFFAEAGAVKNGKGIESSPGSIGSSTTGPDLSSVSSVIGTTQWDFRYDQPVTDVDVSKFAVYAADGTEFQATGFARPSAEVVRIAIPALHEFPEDIVVAAAEHGAVKADDGSDTPSTVGAERVGSSTLGSGRTSGPDLESASRDTAAGQIRYRFDENVDDDLTYDPSDFMAVMPNGDLVQARSVVEIDDDTVLVNFDKNIVAAAEAVAINHGAVKDFQGEESPAATVNA
jgi:hypothetical protein